jgi:soluble lytic murein transglycosylase
MIERPMVFRESKKRGSPGVVLLLAAGAVFWILPGVAHPSTEKIASADSVSAEANAADQDCLDPEACFHQAVRALSREGSSGSEALLKKILEAFPDSPWAARAAFRLGTLALAGQNGDAGAYFRRAMPLKSVRHYILFYRAAAARQQHEYAEALADYRRILSDFPDSGLRPETLFESALTQKESGDCASAIEAFDSFTAQYREHDRAPQAFLNATQCALQMGDSEKATKAVREVLIHFPADPAARDAAKIIADMESAGIKIASLTPHERFHRAETLYGSARYREALDDYRSVSMDAKGLLGEEATVKLAITHIQLRQYPEARGILTDYIPSSKFPKLKLEALYWQARLAVRLGQKRLLLKTEKQMSTRFRSSERTGRVLIYLGGFYEDRNRPKEAVRAYRRVIARFKGNEDLVHDAVWRIGWMEYRKGRYGKAIRVFSEHTNGHSDEENLGKFQYWIGRSNEQLKKRAKAISAYRDACEKARRNYYCQMAQERLRGLASDSGEAGTGEVQAVSMDSESGGGRSAADIFADSSTVDLGREPAYRAARELLVLGLNREASGELEFLTDHIGSNRAALFELSTLLYQAGDYYHSLRILRMYFRDLINENGDDAPDGFWKRVYPFAIIDTIKSESVPGSADPYVVAAVIREESAFNQKAISIAGAVGLMQLMPETAEFVADKIGHPDFNPERLVDPEVNIRLGSWYLGHLARKFDGRLIPTIASYNAGPDAVSAWIKKRPPKNDAWDEFIESIPYSETRAYTKRVVRSYTEYLRLAHANPMDRFDRPILSSR